MWTRKFIALFEVLLELIVYGNLFFSLRAKYSNKKLPSENGSF
jgi:hypothetical protein